MNRKLKRSINRKKKQKAEAIEILQKLINGFIPCDYTGLKLHEKIMEAHRFNDYSKRWCKGE